MGELGWGRSGGGGYAGAEDTRSPPAYVYRKPAHGCSRKPYSRMPELRAEVPSVDPWLSKLHFPMVCRPGQEGFGASERQGGKSDGWRHSTKLPVVSLSQLCEADL